MAPREENGSRSQGTNSNFPIRSKSMSKGTGRQRHVKCLGNGLLSELEGTAGDGA